MQRKDENMKFEDLKLNNALLAAVHRKGFEKPTEIQEKIIPLALEGRDLIGQARTGTGKTAAFGFPILQRINPASHVIEALVVVPTRELALQVKEELADLARESRVQCMAVFGGQSINVQAQHLQRKPSIVVGTPGRLMDFMRQRVLDFKHLKFLVLDEADKMFDMGFQEDIQMIVSQLPKERQTMLFSATMPEPIRRLAEVHMKQDKEYINVSEDKLTVDEVDQYFIAVDHKQKVSMLSALLKHKNVQRGVVFCRTQRTVDWLSRMLRGKGIRAEAMHGAQRQTQRNRVLDAFKSGRTNILVSTNLVSRGLHIEDITHVINFDFPQEPETYVHRIGRTARQGKRGEAITFCTNLLEVQELKKIEDITGARIKEIRPVQKVQAQPVHAP
ncbi:MAG: DEAD/DEAH box helicase [Candidatus Diapherotrites archaeon]|nr:DEAD/DEAH box helicase [Candidatus Diapherotrites archaeon]